MNIVVKTVGRSSFAGAKMSRPRISSMDEKPPFVDGESFMKTITGGCTLDQQPSAHPASTTLRIYLHTDCTDALYERQALWHNVFPSLRSYARQLGLHLHIIDPYHIISNVAMETETSSSMLPHLLEMEGVYELNVKEISTCQDVSAGFSFITLFGQKYGHRALKEQIEKDDFDLLSATIEDVAMRNLLRQYYQIDKTTSPLQYTLKRPSLISDDWIKEHEDLSRSVRKGAKVAFGKDPIKVQNYTLSVNEEEITHGIFNCPRDKNQSCVWFKRLFSDLFDQKPSTDPALCWHSDVAMGRRGVLEFDSETVKLLNYLKEARMPAKYIGLDPVNIFDFPIKWHKNKGLSPDTNEEHAAYLTSLADKVTIYFKGKLSEISDKVELELSYPLYQECLLHIDHCRRLIANLKDRSDIIGKVFKYIKNSNNTVTPLVVYGVPGSGKSSIMASIFNKITEGSIENSHCCVMRFIGHTPTSSNIRSTLESICQQIKAVYDYKGHIPADHDQLIDTFNHLISVCPSPEQPLYILLDGIDHLNLDNEGLGLPWLPINLPQNVKIVVSVSSEDKHRCYPILRNVIKDQMNSFVKVPTLGLNEAETYLEHFLNQYKLKISATHLYLLSDSLKKNVSLTPLHLKTVAIIAKKYGPQVLQMQEDFNSIMNVLFSNIEETHGKLFVSTTLELITASHYGMTEDELLDILSCKQEILSEIQMKLKNLSVASVGSIQQVPILAWSRLLHELYPHFLCFRVVMGGVRVLQWSSRGVREAAMQRYLKPEEKLVTTCQTLVDYFTGNTAAERSQELLTLEKQSLVSDESLLVGNSLSSQNGNQIEESDNRNESTPTTENKSESASAKVENEAMTVAETKSCINNSYSKELIRSVSDQPLLLNDDVYNIRRMTELPWALHKAKQYSALLRLIFDYHFLQANVEMRLLDNVLDYLTLLYDPVPISNEEPGRLFSTRGEVSLLRKAIALSMDSLVNNPSQLCVELLGRLLMYGLDRTDRVHINDLLTQAVNKDLPCLTPLQPYSSLPLENHLLTMSGHFKPVTQIDSTITLVNDVETDEVYEEMVLVSSSMDGTVRSWDWKGSGTLRIFDDPSEPEGRRGVLCVSVSKNGKYVVSGGEDCAVRYWSVSDATCLHVLRGHRGAVKGVCITKDCHKVISGSLDSTVKVWNTDQSSNYKGQLVFTFIPSCDLSPRVGIPIHSISLCKSDTELVCGLENGYVVVTNILAGEILRSYETSLVSPQPVSSIAVAQVNKRRMVVSVSDNSAHLCCYNTGKHIDSVPCNLPSINGKLAAYDQHSILKRIPITESNITTFSFANFGALGISGDKNGSIRVWDLEKHETPKAHNALVDSGRVYAVACSQCGGYVSTSSINGKIPTINVWQLTDLIAPCISLTDDSVATCLKFLKKSNQLISGHKDGGIRLWNTDTKQIEDMFSCTGSKKVEFSLCTGSEAETTVTCIAVSSDYKVLFAGTSHGEISTWNLEKKIKIHRKLDDHYPTSIVSILVIPMSKSDKYIITADQKGTTIVRDYRTLEITKVKEFDNENNAEESQNGNEAEEFQNGNEAKESQNRNEANKLCCMEIGQDSVESRWLIGLAFTDGTIVISSIPDMVKITSFKVQHGILSSINFTHGKLITTTCRDNKSGCVQIWDEDICVGMVLTDSDITMATVKPIEYRNGAILVYGCRNGYIGAYLYDPYARRNEHGRHMVAELLKQQNRLDSINKPHIEGLGMRSNRSLISQTTLHSLVEEIVQGNEVTAINNEEDRGGQESSSTRTQEVASRNTIPQSGDRGEMTANQQPEPIKNQGVAHENVGVAGSDSSLDKDIEQKPANQQNSSSTCILL